MIQGFELCHKFKTIGVPLKNHFAQCGPEYPHDQIYNNRSLNSGSLITKFSAFYLCRFRNTSITSFSSNPLAANSTR